MQLTATAIYSDGSSADITATAMWSVDSTNCASVSGGLITATLGQGSCSSLTITASEGTIKGSAHADIKGLFAGASALPGSIDYYPNGVAVGDLTGDGVPDVVITDNATAYLGIFVGTGDGNLALDDQVAMFGRSPVIADFNGDHKADIAMISGGSVAMLPGDGQGGFGLPATFSLPALGTLPVISMVTGDFNGDGKPDLAIATAAGVAILLGDGNGGFASPATFAVGVNPAVVATGDFNGDGKLDLAVTDYYAGRVFILLGDGTGSFGTPTAFTVGGRPSSIAVGDFNGDGNLDLAVATGNKSIVILSGDGTGGFTSTGSFATGGATAVSVATADFNGDGKLDLVTVGTSSTGISGVVSVLFGTGSGSFAAPITSSVGENLTSVAVADLSGDGKPDLIVVDESNAGSGVSTLLHQ
jgi:hypothetical protein